MRSNVNICFEDTVAMSEAPDPAAIEVEDIGSVDPLLRSPHTGPATSAIPAEDLIEIELTPDQMDALLSGDWPGA